jgi:hypothetical protein
MFTIIMYAVVFYLIFTFGFWLGVYAANKDGIRWPPNKKE